MLTRCSIAVLRFVNEIVFDGSVMKDFSQTDPLPNSALARKAPDSNRDIEVQQCETRIFSTGFLLLSHHSLEGSFVGHILHLDTTSNPLLVFNLAFQHRSFSAQWRLQFRRATNLCRPEHKTKNTHY